MEKYQTGKNADENFWKEFKHKTNASLPKNHIDLWTGKYKTESKKDQDILRLIKKLKSKKYTIALLSNTIPPHAIYNRKHKHFDLFDHTILSNETGLRKPDRRIYKLALEKLNLKPETCVYIDDI